MKKNLMVYQDNNKECGSACLLSIMRYYGGDIPLNTIVELTCTNHEGTNFYELTKAGYELGLTSTGYDVQEYNNLEEINKPFIAQVNNNGLLHFVVVYNYDSRKVIIMDPARGKVTLNKKQFIESFLGKILVLEPYKNLVVHKSNNYLKELIKSILKSNKKIILSLLILSIIFTILTCIYSFYFQIILEQKLNLQNLQKITLIFSVILIIKILTNYFRNYLLIYLNKKIDLSIFLKTYKKILTLPYNYYKTKTTGEVISRVNDLSEVKNLISKALIVIFLDILITIGGGIVLYIISKELFLYLIIIILLYILIFSTFKSKIKKLTTNNQEDNAKVNSLLIESISGFESIKGLNIETKFLDKMEKKYHKLLNTTVALDRLVNIEEFLKNIVTDFGILLLMQAGFKLILNDSLTIGSLITFTSLLTYFINPVRSIIDTSKDYFFVSSSIKRANNLLNIEGEKLNEGKYANLSEGISIKNLDFKYNSTKSVLKNVNIDINKNEKVLIIGKSGGGKSTLLKLIYGYYKVSKNKILISSKDINDYSLSDIRKNIGYISQSETIYTDTIKNNIILDRDVPEEKFIKICKLTKVDEIAASCPLGYETALEENGINLSGGQRQRIVLARMLLKDCQIILIDEGLNQIDINNERIILQNIFKEYTDKIIMIVSHRFNNNDLYNKIIKIEDNTIKEVIEKNKTNL